MCWRHQSYLSIVSALIAVILVSGCATTATTRAPYWDKTSYGSWRLLHAEVKKLPNISIRNILSSASLSEHQKIRILVKAQNLDGIAEVKHISGHDDVIVADTQGQEVRIKIAQITEIQSIRQIKIEPRQKTAGEKAEEVGEVLTYAPFTPLIATLPFLRAMGLDAGNNDEDEEKAMGAYGGMSKEDLITYVGEPMEKYHCDDKYGGHEVWVYKKGQVLRGGRALFIGLSDEKVFHTSYNTTFFKDSCSLLKTTP